MDMLKAFLLKTPVYFKMGALLFLILILLIPIGMIDNVIGERRMRQNEVSAEISQVWGRSQRLFGPVLILPYRQPVERTDRQGNVTMGHAEGRAFVLPETLTIAAVIDPEIRYRGIFETVVYRGDARIAGAFARPDPEALGLADAEIFWDRAVLAAGVTDLRGTRGDLTLRFGDLETRFAPDTTSETIGGGVHAPVGAALAESWAKSAAAAPVAFDFGLDLAGSGRISFVPSAKETEVKLTSPWPHPRFEGAWLPTGRAIGKQGFEAGWSVSYFGRDFPQHWLERDASDERLGGRIARASFGASLITPVDFYVKSERSVKYAMLFLLLVFATVFVLEVAVPIRMHLVQYALVGFAMTVFYLLLLALAEVIGFAAGFTLAAAVSMAMIALYLGKAMKSRARGVQVAGILAGIYGFLYVVLQLEDYALLTGTIGVTIALAAVMYATRNMDWYRLTGAGAEKDTRAAATE